ncbi:MAG: PorV/PorQ family protein [Candidatus Kapabacteria bacterium]|nr:PorV/PorQ family protein [Candidatus Kapabacteria bacterium]
MNLKIIALFCILYSLFYTNFLSAQSSMTMPVLLENPDARSSGMGEAGTAISDDISATYLNPAGLGFLKKTIIDNQKYDFFGVSLAYNKVSSNIISDMSLFNIAVASYLPTFRGCFALDLSRNYLGESHHTDASGNPKGKFASIEYLIGLAYGISFSEQFAAGAKIKYFLSDLAPAMGTIMSETSSAGLAFDLALMLHPQINIGTNPFLDKHFLSFGLTLQNMGGKVDYLKSSEPLPTVLKLGTAINFNYEKTHKLTLAADAVKLLIRRNSLTTDPFPLSLGSSWKNEGGFIWKFGAEYWYEHIFALRLGHYFEPAVMGNRSYYTFGCSFHYYFAQLDLRYATSSGITQDFTNGFKFTLKIAGD